MIGAIEQIEEVPTILKKTTSTRKPIKKSVDVSFDEKVIKVVKVTGPKVVKEKVVKEKIVKEKAERTPEQIQKAKDTLSKAKQQNSQLQYQSFYKYNDYYSSQM